MMRILKGLKGYHIVYKLSPDTHQKKKKTFSFGGIGILINTLIAILFFKLFSVKVIWVYLLSILFGFIGFIDDYLSLKRKDNEGLTPLQKFSFQAAVAILCLVFYHFKIQPISIFNIILYWFVIVGTANATNLSDGLDGLLAGLSIFTLSGFIFLFEKMGFVHEQGFSIVLMIAIAVFLAFNIKPAKIFMGDTGSLAVGGAFAGLAIVSGNPWVLIIIGAVYVLEALSVIIQVAVFKLRRKRIFLMAPLHHHFELMGLSEGITVGLFWFFGLIFFVLFLYRLGVI
jgi:phospho-N-acetylmuramoyl-pentapeptide-transferase